MGKTIFNRVKEPTRSKIISALKERYLNTYEFQVYPLPFIVFTMLGFWCPSNWTRTAKCYYHLYTLFQFAAISLFLSQIIFYMCSKIYYDGKLDTTPFFSIVAIIFGIGRILTFTFDHSWVVDILKTAFDERLCKPRNGEEVKITEDFVKSVKNIHVVYVTTLGFAASIKIGLPFIQCRLEGSINTLATLPIAAWYPYDVGKPVYYEITILHELTAVILTILSNIGADILVSALMMQVCLQCRILSYRISHNMDDFIDENPTDDLTQFQRDKEIVTTFTEDHLFIIGFAEKLNKAFMIWFAVMVILPGPCLILNVYEILRCQKIMCIITPSAMIAIALTELSLIYWCGSDITDQSIVISDAIYESGWIDVHRAVRKDYILTMTRAYRRPISLSVIKIIRLNIDSMVAVSININIFSSLMFFCINNMLRVRVD